MILSLLKLVYTVEERSINRTNLSCTKQARGTILKIPSKSWDKLYRNFDTHGRIVASNFEMRTDM